MGWFDDAGSFLKSAGKTAADAGKSVGGVLINEDAWGAVLPGGKKATMSDWANVALDSTLLIPGAGLVGGGARVGGRLAAKKLAREATAEAAERAAAKAVMRSPASNAVRGKLAGSGARASKLGDDTLAKMAPYERMVKKSARSKRMVPNPVKPTAFQRAAGKQQAGLGRKVGMGQTKRRTFANAALTGGANLLTEAYDRGMFGFGGDSGENPAAGDAARPGGGGSFDPGDYGIMVGGDGSLTIPPGLAAAMAAMFAAQNGGTSGMDVVSSN